MGNEQSELNDKLHTELCEIMPTVCEDSGQAEWSRRELQEMIDAFMDITEYWNYRKDAEQNAELKSELSQARKENERLKNRHMEMCDEQAGVNARLENEIAKRDDALKAACEIATKDCFKKIVELESRLEAAKHVVRMAKKWCECAMSEGSELSQALKAYDALQNGREK